MTAPFAPGDRVLVEAQIWDTDKHVPLLRFADGAYARAPVSSICAASRSIPTPASQLRAAAEVLVKECGWKDEVEHIPWRLYRQADHLEASAAPKPPTLKEAAQAVVRSGQSGGRDMDTHLLALERALAREGAKP